MLLKRLFLLSENPRPTKSGAEAICMRVTFADYCNLGNVDDVLSILYGRAPFLGL